MSEPVMILPKWNYMVGYGCYNMYKDYSFIPAEIGKSALISGLKSLVRGGEGTLIGLCATSLSELTRSISIAIMGLNPWAEGVYMLSVVMHMFQ